MTVLVLENSDLEGAMSLKWASESLNLTVECKDFMAAFRQDSDKANY